MRHLIAALTFLALSSGTAHALNLRASTRRDHEALDVLVRRCEWMAKEARKSSVRRCAKISALHCEAMRARRGGEFKPERQIPVPDMANASKEESALIFTLFGNASADNNLSEILSACGTSWWGDFKRWTWHTFIVSAPWIGLLLIGWRVLKSKDAALQRTFDRIAEMVPDKKERSTRFGDEEIDREYQKRKKREERAEEKARRKAKGKAS